MFLSFINQTILQSKKNRRGKQGGEKKSFLMKQKTEKIKQGELTDKRENIVQIPPLRVEKSVKKEFDQFAENMDCSRAMLYRYALDDFLDNYRDNQKDLFIRIHGKKLAELCFIERDI